MDWQRRLTVAITAPSWAIRLDIIGGAQPPAPSMFWTTTGHCRNVLAPMPGKRVRIES